MKSCLVGPALASVSLVLLMSSTAQAQATRTWVSGVGNDADPCSRTAPCQTFAGAIAKTLAGGEINVLDAGGFGTVTITKSISIIAPEGFGGILNSGTSGVIVNGPNIVVRLTGILIDGAGALPGVMGVNFVQGSSLHLNNCVIINNKGGVALGIRMAPSAGTADLIVTNTVISNNGTGVTGGGIHLAPTGTGAITALLKNVTMSSNVFGLKADASTAVNGVFATVRDSSSNANNFSGLTAVTAPGGGFAWIMAEGLTSSNNGTTGVKSDGTGAIVTVGGSTISMNGIGFQFLNGGQLLTAGNNTLFGNGSNGAASGGLPPS